MRLINVHSLELRWFARDKPRYAIASHRWLEDETTYSAFLGKQDTDKKGYQKVIAFARYVRENVSAVSAVDWVWIDTCCINKDSSAELQEAITSMFRWYRDAALCLTLLSDVPDAIDRNRVVKSVWFDRGWTLQELLAPRLVIFLSSKWQVVGHKGELSTSSKAINLEIGPNLHEDIANRTCIPREVLEDYEKSLQMDVRTKRRWMSERDTTREEDKIYALFGILDCSIFINYGEKYDKAERRLLNELRASEDAQTELRSLALVRRQSSAKTDRIRSWLQPLPSIELRDQLRECRVDGTCSWIIELVESKAWLEPKSTQTTIWIHGGPGFGKSVTSAALVDHLEAVASRPVAHFFCSATDESLRLPTNILRTCIAQAVHQSTLLLRLAEDFRNKSQTGIATEKELHSLLSAMTNEEAGIIVIIDGFDECHEYESEQHRRCRLNRQRFLQQLTSVFAGTASRLILISRDEQDIRSAFCTPGQDTLLEHVVHYGIETTDVHVDIQKFCYAQVESSTSLSQQTDSLRNDVLDHLISGSDGMFLFASLQCALLAQAKNVAQLRRRMEDIPRDLGSFYERYWQRIMGFDDLEQKRVLRILRWVTFVAEPLTVPALFEAIALQDEDGKLEISKEWLPMQNITERVARTDLLDACKPFLVLKRSASIESLAGTTVQLGHFSMKAFLTERFKHPGQKKKLSSAKNPILAELCVGYLAAGVPWKPIMSTDPCLQSHPLLSYVLFNLTQHFEHGDDTFEYARKLMLDFYDPVNQYWTNWRDEFERQVNVRDRRLSSNGRPGGRCYYAAAQGLDFVLEQLLAGNANIVNIVGGSYGTPLQVACFNGSVSTVIVLLRHAAAVNLGAGIYGTALHAAVSAGVLRIVETLITHGADASAVNASGRTALLEAIWHEHWSVVPCLILATTRVDLACTFGNTPLSTAAQKQHSETIRSLVKRGACLNPSSGIVNPLHAACRQGKSSAAALLIRLGADANMRDSRGRTPLIAAAESGNHAMIRVLLDAGADPHVATPDGWKALPIASKNGHAKVVRALIDCGAGTATYAPDGRTSFLLAVESGHLETVQIFIDRKANPFALCSSTTFRVGLTTVYHKAAADNNLELVNVFLDAGVPLDHTAFDGNTLLHHAATYGSLRTIRGLLERGADPALRNHKNRRPLCCAALYNETDVVKILLKHVSRRSDSSDLIHSALVTAIGNCSAGIVRLLYDAALASYTTSERNRDPMLIAAERGRTDNVRALLARGAYVDVPGVRGRTPLYMAASCRHLRMVQFLLSQGANPELADSEGMTALHGAARAGCPLVIKALLDGGAQVNHMAMGYLTPLAVAAKREDVLKQLLSHGADAHIICYSCDSTLSTILHSKKRMTFGIPLAHRRSYTVRWRDQLGRSFIHMAAARGFSCCISASIGARVSVNMPDEQQWTPLHWAAYFGHEELSKWLVRIGANPLAIDQQRRTPAHVAAIAGHVTVAQSLDVIPRVENPDYAQDDRWPEAD